MPGARWPMDRAAAATCLLVRLAFTVVHGPAELPDSGWRLSLYSRPTLACIVIYPGSDFKTTPVGDSACLVLRP